MQRQCFRELYLHTLYRRFGFRQHCLRLKKAFDLMRKESIIQMRYRDKFLAMHNKRRKNNALLVLSEYAKRKIFEKKNSDQIKANKIRALKALTWRSVLRFVAKAKAVKGDPI